MRFPVPQNVRQIQSFLGLCSYFRKFVEGFAVIAKPLYNLLKSGVEFKFTEIELRAFESLKSRLTVVTYIVHLLSTRCDRTAL